MSRTRDHIRTATALTLAVGALTAPAASARPAALDPVASTSAPAPATISTARSDGFSWGDGAVGAGGVLVLTAIGLTGIASAGRRDERRRSATSPTTTA